MIEACPDQAGDGGLADGLEEARRGENHNRIIVVVDVCSINFEPDVDPTLGRPMSNYERIVADGQYSITVNEEMRRRIVAYADAVWAWQEEAQDVVTAWADATTQRDFTEAARIDPTRSPDDLEMMYGGADDPVRMLSVQPYFAGATQDGQVGTLTGAAISWDYDPEPTIRTHVICSEWEVDLDTGTAAWTTGADRFFPAEQIPSDEFAEAFDDTCT
jgi:hypothetical protein